MNKKKKSLKLNYIFNLINQILAILLPLVLAPYISRVLQPEGVGKYSFVNSIITYFTLFASLGFGFYAQREIAKYQEDKEKQAIVFWEIFIARCFSVALSLVLNLFLIVIGVYGNNALFMLILSINILSIVFDISYFFQGNEEFGRIVIRNIVVKLLMTISIFLLVKDKGDLWLYILLHSLAIFISNISLWPTLFKVIPKAQLSELKPFRHMKQVIILFLPTIATSIYTVLDKTLIGVITGSDAQNGFYEQAEKIVKCALTLITCLDLVMIPRNSNEFQKGNIEGVKNNIYKAFHFVWLLGIPIALGLSVVASHFLPWYLGSSFNSSIILLEILSFLILIIGCSSILGTNYLIPTKQDKKYTAAILTGAGLNLVLNIILIYIFGAVGAAISTITAEFTITIVMFLMVRKELSYKQIFKTIYKPAIAGLIMFIALIILKTYLTPSILSTLILIAVGVIIYFILILILRDGLVKDLVIDIKKKIKNKFSSHTKQEE